MKCSQLIVTETRGVGFEETVKKLGGLVFNRRMRGRAGQAAKAWASGILSMMKETHELGVIGLVRAGNLHFHQGRFGYKHLFMALRVSDSGIAKCGIDPKYC